MRYEKPRLPGERLAFGEIMEAASHWPPSYQPLSLEDRSRVLRPALVIPNGPLDHGRRPLNPAEANRCASLCVVDEQGFPTTRPVVGGSYLLTCRVFNAGAMPSFVGVVDFYAAPPATLDHLAWHPRPGITPVGRATAIVPAGRGAQIVCASRWSPKTRDETGYSILAQVYDLATDPLVHPFDSQRDPHVGRLDLQLQDQQPDLTGQWLGTVRLMGYAADPGAQLGLWIRQPAPQLVDVAVYRQGQYGARSIDPSVIYRGLPLGADATGQPLVKHQETRTLKVDSRKHEVLETDLTLVLVNSETLSYSLMQRTRKILAHNDAGRRVPDSPLDVRIPGPQPITGPKLMLHTGELHRQEFMAREIR